MEAKKNKSADLTRKSGYYFSIGLFLAMAMAVMAFEWRQPERAILDLGRNQDFPPELIDIPPTTDIPPPPVPAPMNRFLVEVDINVKPDSIPPIDIEASELLKPVEFIVPVPEPEEPTDVPMTFPEESAFPKGGFAAFYNFVGDKIKYPVQARRMGIEGRVYVEFVINKDGTLTDVKAIKGIGAGCDQEAVRIVQSSPAWNPGKQRGKAVKQRYTIPIIFKLG